MKVLIVDDEHLICEWMQFCIEQNKEYTLVGVANNGKDALEIFLEKEPDLVITDIKMPVMDGLALLDAIRKVSETTLVVLLTAFSDFDLARNALRNGANEYLLKTEMQNQTFQELLVRMSEKCGAKDKGSSVEHVHSAQAHTIICELLKRKAPLSDEDINTLKQVGLKWKNNGLFALAIWKTQLMKNGVEFIQSEHVVNIAGFDDFGAVYVLVAYVANISSQTQQKRVQLEYAKAMQQKNKCMVGISDLSVPMTHINNAIKQASFALGQGFYSEELRLYEPQCAYEKQCEKISQWKTEFQALRYKLPKLSQEQRLEEIECLLENTNYQNACDVQLFATLCGEMLDAFCFATKEGSAAVLQAEENKKEIANSMSSFRQARNTLVRLCHECLPAQNQTHQPKSKAINIAVNYMKSQYKTALSLEQTAAEVYLNAEYFSRIFKEEMGCTFIAYLTELRLNHALHLLENTAMRVQNIAQEVGYPNVSHFSTTFKKKYGVSPYEYRQKSSK